MKTAAQTERRVQPIALDRGEHSAALTALAGGELDELKFRIVRRGQCHYFSDVRFRDDEDGRRIARFLEGQAIEQLNPETLGTVFGTAAIIVPLQTMLGDLKSVFC